MGLKFTITEVISRFTCLLHALTSDNTYVINVYIPFLFRNGSWKFKMANLYYLTAFKKTYRLHTTCETKIKK